MIRSKALFICLLLCTHFVIAGEIVIVTGVHSPITQMGRAELKKIYIGKQTTVQGHFVTPVLHKNMGIHKIFLKEYLSLNARQFARTWQKLIFTGKGQTPKKIVSYADFKKNLNQNESVIGYMDSSKLTKDVKTITIVGE